MEVYNPKPKKRHPILAGCLIISGVLLVALFISAAFGGGGKNKSSFLSNADQVAVVEINGVILDCRDTIEEIEEHRKNDSIKAVVVRIDSPGGAVGPSQEIYSTLKKLNKDKPVVASMGAVAASGGYYIALGARKIVANPGTITGSIGVIMEMSNLEELMKWAKIRQEVIKSGPYKDIGSPFRPLTDTEREKLNKFVGDVYDQFVTAIVENRKMKKEDVLKIADGMIYSGNQALNLKLIDKLGTIQDAIDLAAKEAGIKGEPEVVYPEKPSFVRELLESRFKKFDEIISREGIRVMYLLRI